MTDNTLPTFTGTRESFKSPVAYRRIRTGSNLNDEQNALLLAAVTIPISHQPLASYVDNQRPVAYALVNHNLIKLIYGEYGQLLTREVHALTTTDEADAWLHRATYFINSNLPENI
jgi:hypothetical protein